MPSRNGAAGRGGRDGGAARLEAVQRRTRAWAADPEVRRWLSERWDRYLELCWDWTGRSRGGRIDRESHPGTLSWRRMSALPPPDRLAVAAQVVIGVHDAGAIDPIVPPTTQEQWGTHQQGNVDWKVRTEATMREMAMPLRGCRVESDGALDPRRLRPEFAEQCLELVQREYRAQMGGPVEGGTSEAASRAEALELLLERYRAAVEEIRTEWKRADAVMAEFEASGMGRETGGYERISADEHASAWSMTAKAFDRVVLKLLPLAGDSLRTQLLDLWDELGAMGRDCRAGWSAELDRRISRVGLLLEARHAELRQEHAPAREPSAAAKSPPAASRSTAASSSNAAAGSGDNAADRSSLATRITKISVSMAEARYMVTAQTLRTAVKDGRLTDFRPTGSAENSPFILDEEQVARLWRRRDGKIAP